MAAAVTATAARTRVRRLPELQVDDRAAMHAVLDEALVAHVGVTDETGQPFVLPCAVARDGDRVLLHGSTGSRLFRRLTAGAPACITVTILDGLVVAASLFESSMRYRSVMVLGRAVGLDGEEKRTALDRLADRLLPGRSVDARPPSRKELAATAVAALGIDEWSLKVSDGDPDTADEDAAYFAGRDRPWTGVVPLRLQPGPPDADWPEYVRAWRR
jgi:nitroimidazol reductase NimA-like FMN-containing flavoprotein (pyridoxamine 5'-phosphate oxidase superfamily)